MFRFFKSDFFDFEFLRVIGTAPVLGAEIGECLEVAALITDGNIESWYSAWTLAARKAEVLGEEAIQHKDREGAKWAYLRAFNYWRASEFFLHCNPQDPRILEVYDKSVVNFKKGVSLLDGAVHFLDIPYEGTTKFPGYLFLPPKEKQLKNAKIPLIVHTGGFDSTQEELYFYVASGATSRGYAVLIFDGPGQGKILRHDKISFRPDWEYVTGKVLDYVVSTLIPEQSRQGSDLDASRIAIFGASMGGYLALRGAADPRIKAAISCDGFYDLFDITRSRMPPWFINAWVSGRMGDGIFNWVVNILGRHNFQLAWEFGHGKWTFGVGTPADVLRAMQRFTLKLARDDVDKDDTEDKEFLAQVHCPVLVTGAADTMYFTPDLNARRIYTKLDHLDDLEGAERKLWVAEGPAAGGLQAKIAAIGIKQQRLFAWLDEQFGVAR
ncbi:MAG: hypothetical protein M1819_005820 [Sarea resinae]|nr:MAG: hypothetical protein M1819_005820 [Sarea resinae]